MADAAARARQTVLDSCPKDVDDDVVEYLAQTAADLFEDEDADVDELRENLEGTAVPLLENVGISAEEATAFCERILGAALGKSCSGAAAVGVAEPGAKAGAGGASADCLLRVPNMLLMYGGSPTPLLRNALLELRRGHRYGVVGANGTGKTTLMAKLATKDIAGFPQDVRVVHLRHEAILRGIGPKVTAREYADLRNQGSTAASAADLAKSLEDVGFEGDEMLDKAVHTLSGGWQMRLALACAVAQKASLMLLDEPTNHLDTEAAAWLVSFIQRTCVSGEVGGTAMIVSHDADFLNQVCTNVIHFTADAKLVYHQGNFESFKKEVLKGDDAKAQQLLEVAERHEETDARRMNFGGLADRLIFPTPERIPGAVPGKPGPPVLTLKRVSFTYPGAETPVLRDLALEMLSTSRIGIVGRNGSGKSTLLSLIGGRVPPFPGEIWTHHSLRLVYIAQHHESQIGEFLENTPVEYMQMRFRRGFDPEALPPHLKSTPLSDNQVRRIRELAKKKGKSGREVETIVGRQISGKESKDVLYEVKWQGLSPAHNSYEKRSRLKELGVEYLACEYDMFMAAAWGTAPERPLTQRELIGHFEDFGLPEEVSTKRKLSMLSSGQRSKVMLAASFWTRPHMICLDEPTNYLDTDTVEALAQALRRFKGGYAIVSHSEGFIADTCEEIWTVADGSVAVSHRGGLQGLEEAAA